jgi:hypothetical protein
MVAGSKGGVGTTTLTAVLLRAARDRDTPVVGLDLTPTNDLARALDQRAIAISSVVRHRERMPTQVDRALRRKMPFLALDIESAMYAERLAEMVRLLAARRLTIADVGNAFGTRGARPLTPHLSLATHIVVVLIPDVRAIARAERLLNRWEAHRAKIVLVENMAGGTPMLPEAAVVPRSASRTLGRLIREPAGDAIRALLDRVSPQQEARGKAPADEPSESRGIIRSLVTG